MSFHGFNHVSFQFHGYNHVSFHGYNHVSFHGYNHVYFFPGFNAAATVRVLTQVGQSRFDVTAGDQRPGRVGLIEILTCRLD